MDLEQRDEQQLQPVSGLKPWLKIFFGAVVLCAVFFALGYTFGRNAAPITSPTLTSDPKPVRASSDKPSAAQSPNAAITEIQSPSSQQSDLTFYKSVENKPDGQLSPPPAEQSKPAQTQSAQAGAGASTAKIPPELANAKIGGTIAVQVAAVTKEEDADALVGALRNKSYPVFVVNVPGDKLFHVQVGPFAELKDAEAVRARLASDGYNPIIKK
jgi:septal ring-binding cell division protein DamX